MLRVCVRKIQGLLAFSLFESDASPETVLGRLFTFVNVVLYRRGGFREESWARVCARVCVQQKRKAFLGEWGPLNVFALSSLSSLSSTLTYTHTTNCVSQIKMQHQWAWDLLDAGWSRSTRHTPSSHTHNTVIEVQSHTKSLKTHKSPITSQHHRPSSSAWRRDAHNRQTEVFFPRPQSL